MVAAGPVQVEDGLLLGAVRAGISFECSDKLPERGAASRTAAARARTRTGGRARRRGRQPGAAEDSRSQAQGGGAEPAQDRRWQAPGGEAEPGP